MKKLAVTLLILCLNALLVTSQVNVPVEIECKNAPAEVTVEAFQNEAFKPQKVKVENNKINLSLPVDDIEFYKITFTQRNFIVIIVEPTNKKINISVDANDIYNTIKIEGSPFTKLVYDTEASLNETTYRIESLVTDFERLPGNVKPSVQNIFQEQIDSLQKVQVNILLDFIKKHTDNPAALFFIDKINIDENYNLAKTLADNLQKKYPKNPVIKNYATRIEAIKNSAIGNIIPNIALPGVNGDTISLYPLEGKLTVVDFWASWCGPCRKSNPKKVEMYEKYKDKGLSMYSISLDNNAINWKYAIEADKLTWKKHVSELKGWKSSVAQKFSINSIPANIIIDENGKIIAKNLRGEEYQKFIEEYFNKK